MGLALNAQNDDDYLEAWVAPALGFKAFVGLKPPSSYKGDKNTYRDSLNKMDRPGQMLNFGAAWFMKRNALDAFSLGLSYTSLGWQRYRENLQIGDEIYPDSSVGNVAGLIQKSSLDVEYNYRFRHIAVDLIWYTSGKAFANRDVSSWFVYGFSPAVLIRQNIIINTIGFTQNGQTQFKVKDRDNKGMPANIFLVTGYRFDVKTWARTNVLVQPMLRVPLLPSSTGQQSVWLPQLSVNFGLVYALGKKK